MDRWLAALDRLLAAEIREHDRAAARFAGSEATAHLQTDRSARAAELRRVLALVRLHATGR